MKLNNKRIFISGGNGVIGNELVNILSKTDNIIFVGDLKPRPLHWSTKIRYRQGDLNYITKEEIEDFKPEIFIHLAATFERSTETFEFWEENSWHNVRLSTYLMSLLKEVKCLEKVVFASSYLIYNPELYLFDKPQNDSVGLKETDPIYPRNLTGVAKLNHEIELRFLQEFMHEQCKFVSARIYRSYGLNSRDIVSRWVRDLLQGKELQVYCKEGRFDYIFARDVAEALLSLTENENAEGIFNVGNGNARSVEELLQILNKHFPNLKYKEIPSNIPYESSQSDLNKINTLVGWKPRFQLESTIPLIIDFEKNRKIIDFETEKHNVLVTSIAKKVPLLHAVRQAMRKLDTTSWLFGADVDDNCIGKFFVDKFWHMPKISNLKIDEVIWFCKENKIKSIIPTRDGELLYWAMHKTALANNGIYVMISDEQPVDICLDKYKFYLELKKEQLPVIPTAKDINELSCNKFVVKEQFGAGSQSIGLNLLKNEAIEWAKKLENPIFQPFISGDECSVDAYIDTNHNIKGIICRSRDVVINGESQITTSAIIPDINEKISETIKHIILCGHIVFQVLVDALNNIQIIECNSRFGGASTLSIACGLDSFYWFLLESRGIDVSDYPFLKSSTPKMQIRYTSDKIINL